MSSICSFQLEVFSNGNINFVYDQIPVQLSKITKQNLHGLGDTMFGPVVIGLSSRSLMNVTHKYIEVDLDSITNGTSVLISTKIQCSTLLSCQSCLVQDHCQWCGDQCLYQGQQNSSMNSTECSTSCDSNVYYGTKVKFSKEQLDRCVHKLLNMS